MGGKGARLRRLADEKEARDAVYADPCQPNPYPPEDRKHKMFNRHKSDYWHFEDICEAYGLEEGPYR